MIAEDPTISPVEHSRKREISALGEILATRSGRLWVWSLLGRAQIFASTFHQNPTVSAYNEGRRALGVEVLADIARHYPDEYLTMIGEARYADLRRESPVPSAE